MIELELDRTDPMPLYHQIINAIRWRIGTGKLRAGDHLPTLREAAKRWNVNYHTVRRAYQELAAQGWLVSAQGAGTQVAAVPQASDSADDRVQRWLDQVLAAAAEQYGLSPDGLVSLIGERRTVLRVLMVECNEHQSTFLARQLEQAWLVEAIAWPLERAEEPPHLPIIGTYFHHSEMRMRWPDRSADMHFVELHLDPGLKEKVERVAATRGIRALRLLEKDSATAREMAAGVSALLAPRYLVEPVVGNARDVVRTLRDDEMILVAPRLWDELEPAVRADERILDVRHVIRAEDMQRVWRTLTRSTSAASDRPAWAGSRGSSE